MSWPLTLMSSYLLWYSLCPLLTFPSLCPFFRIASRSSFPQWGDSWGQLARDSPTARAVAEARQEEAALPGSMALTSNTIVRALGRALGLALALDLVVQVVLGATRAEEVLLAQQRLARQEQASILTQESSVWSLKQRNP